MKQNCEIILEGLTKEWRKKAIKAAKKAGYRWETDDRIKDADDATHLVFDKDLEIWVAEGGKNQVFDNTILLTLPQDWDKFCECIWDEVDVKDSSKEAMHRMIDNNIPIAPMERVRDLEEELNLFKTKYDELRSSMYNLLNR
ncbi:unnamed protein product [marine sediment metagenome]|uniref:Uncharacterized protein n=1 Tax=marine sediment metagenome TaxID=412755 RepID=X1CE95_9ZZZZ